MEKGRKIRLNRISDVESGNILMVPMDHGVTMGPIDGLRDIGSTVESVENGGGDSVLLHKGMIDEVCGLGLDVGLIVHLNGATSVGPDPNYKVLVADVKEAIRVGGDAVSFHINIGCETEPDQLKELGEVSGLCGEFGLPLVAMTYVRGPDIEVNKDTVSHAARIGAELGADIVKAPYIRDGFEEVTEGCPVPIVIAGGPRAETEKEILTDIKNAMDEGARGVSVGRNIFQHENIESMTSAVSKIVHNNGSVDEAMQELET